jgi:hypothetical protein
MDWPRQGEWMLATSVAGSQGAGARVVARTGFGPVGVTDTMLITEWDPPRRCAVRHTGRLVRGSGVFEVSAVGASRPGTPGMTEFAWSEQLQLPGPVAAMLGRWLIEPAGRWVMQLSLRRFARLVSQ